MDDFWPSFISLHLFNHDSLHLPKEPNGSSIASNELGDLELPPLTESGVSVGDDLPEEVLLTTDSTIYQKDKIHFVANSFFVF